MATEAPFADQEHLGRYARAKALMERAGLDALVVSEKLLVLRRRQARPRPGEHDLPG